MTETEQALQMLFKPDEQTCFGFKAYDTAVYDVNDVYSWKKLPEFMSINPLRKRRLDENVVAYRNILIECDSLGIEEQISHMAALRLPFATCIFSGGKSIHWIISIEDELTSQEEYREYAERIFSVVKVADLKNKNPSRFSRFPGGFREDKQKLQKVMAIGIKIKKAELEAWLLGHGCPKPPPKIKVPKKHVWNLKPSDRTLRLLAMGAPKGERNNEIYIAARDLYSCGYTVDEAYEKLSTAPLSLSDREILNTVKSAYKAAAKEV